MEITEKIREVASLVEIASQYTTLKKRGRKWVGLCPFHTEKTPSFTVDEEKQLYHCFGCGAGGDIFTLVMEKENLNFPEALRYLAEKYHIPMPSKLDAAPGEVKLEEKLFKINEMTLNFFRNNLYHSQEGLKALNYLKKRGISQETVNELKLGYALNLWKSLVDFLQSKAVSASFMEKTGLALPTKKGEYYDRFRGRIIFPISSLSGKVVGFGGRTLFDAEPKYLNSPETPLYSKGRILYGLNMTKNAVRDQGFMILVEGYMDFTALYRAGIKNVAASLGTALTSYQVGLAARFAPRLVLNYDPDPAGLAAAARAIPVCLEKGLNVTVVTLPESADPDEFIKKHGPDKYRAQIKKAWPGLKFYVDSLTAQTDMSIPEEKSRVVQTLVDTLKSIPDPVARNEYLKEAAQYLKTGEDIIRQLIETARKPLARRAEAAIPFCPAEKRLFQIMIQDRSLAAGLAESLESEIFSGLKSEPAFRTIIQSVRDEKDWDLLQLKNALSPEIFSQLTQILLEKSEPGTLEEGRECLCEIRKIFLHKKLKEIQIDIVQSEKQNDRERLLALLYEKQSITKQILSLNGEIQAQSRTLPSS